MHYNSNTKLYITVLCAFIIITGFFVGHMIKSDNFQSMYLNEDSLANISSIDKGTSPSILGDKANLVSFSIKPGEQVSGIVSYKGAVSGAYFFEANILINVLDANKKEIKKSHASATTDWMTAGPVSFEGKLDFTSLPKGPAYIEIHNDNASGLPENDKNILIPVIIE